MRSTSISALGSFSAAALILGLASTAASQPADPPAPADPPDTTAAPEAPPETPPEAPPPPPPADPPPPPVDVAPPPPPPPPPPPAVAPAADASVGGQADANLMLGDTPPGAAAPAEEPKKEESTLDKTLQMLDLFGDLRLRQAFDIDRQASSGDDQPFRHRPRIRFRLGFKFKPSDEFAIVARTTSGNPGDPRSPHQTLGASNGKFAFSLDRAFLSYAPKWAKGLEFAAGKVAHPFKRSSIYNELVFDGDVQPSGLTMKYGGDFGAVGVFGSVGQYIVLVQSNSDDSSATVGQLGTTIKAGPIKMTLAGETYLYWRPAPDASTALLDINAGNATIDGDGDGEADAFASGFKLMQGFADIAYTKFPYPAISAGVFGNLEAEGAESATGWFTGLSVGRTKDPGNIKLYGQYQQVPRESVFTPFSQDDFLVGTDYKGFVGGIKVLAASWLNVHAWTLLASRDEVAAGESKLQKRIRFDLNAKF